jgi:hypothetical protein
VHIAIAIADEFSKLLNQYLGVGVIQRISKYPAEMSGF